MKLDKKAIIFIAVFILLVIVIIYRVLNPFVQQKVETLTFTGKDEIGQNMVAKAIESDGQVESQSLVARFMNKPRISGQVVKDLFLMPRPLQRTAETTEAHSPPTATTTQTDPLAEAKAYLASYKIDGIYESEGTKAVFLSKEKLVLVAKIGDRLDGKYLIEDIQKDHVRIKALDLNETINLDLREFNNE